MLSPNDKIQNLLFLRCMQVCKINHIHHTHYSWGHFSSPSHLTYCHYFASAVITVFLSVLPSVQDIFRHIFLSNYWWQKSDIWSQASYRYPITLGGVFGPIRFLLPVCRLSWFLCTLNIYAHFSQQLLMAEIWYLVTSFI